MDQCSHLPTPLPAFAVISFCGNTHSEWGEMESQRSFNLHFPDCQSCWTLLKMFSSFLCSFSWEHSVWWSLFWLGSVFSLCVASWVLWLSLAVVFIELSEDGSHCPAWQPECHSWTHRVKRAEYWVLLFDLYSLAMALEHARTIHKLINRNLKRESQTLWHMCVICT